MASNFKFNFKFNGYFITTKAAQCPKSSAEERQFVYETCSQIEIEYGTEKKEKSYFVTVAFRVSQWLFFTATGS